MYCGLSYQVDATELIAEASEVDSAAGIERVVPSMYAEIIWPLKSVRHCFQRNRPITYTSRDVTCPLRGTRKAAQSDGRDGSESHISFKS